MRKKFKGLSLVMAVILCIGMLTGCKGTEKNTDTSGTETTKNPTVTEGTAKQDEEPVNLVIYRRGEKSDTDLVTKAINDYTKDKLNITIEQVLVPSADYGSKLTLSMAGGDHIDLFWTASWLSGARTEDLVAQNAVTDITDLLSEYPDLYAVMPEKVWNSAKYNGKNYFVPNYKETGAGYSLLVPKAVQEEFGWDISKISSVYDLEPFLKEAKESGKFEAVYLPTFGYRGCLGIDDYDILGNSIGVSKKGDTTKIVDVAQTEEFQEFIKTMYSWNQAGYMPADVATNNDYSLYQQSGKYAFQGWTTVPDNQQAASTRYGVDVIAKEVTGTYMDSNSALGSAWAISSNSRYADACLKFLQALNTDKTLADLFTYGIEGTHYTKDAAGKVTVTNKDAFGFGTWEACSFTAPSLLATEADNKIELYDTFNESVAEAPTSGFHVDSQPIETELAALATVESEYVDLLERGAVNPDEVYKDYIAARKAAGLENIIAEMQSQYDAWRKLNGK